MTRKAFFDAIRPMFGRAMDPVQVQVIDAILDGTKAWPAAHVAYTLATAFGEAKCTPQRENMSYTAARIRTVWPSRPEAAQFARNPRGLANSVYGKRLGNRPGTDDGWNFRGGGVDQLTGRGNYQRIGISADPEQILRPAVAVKSLLDGMLTGRYTGKKLGDYDPGRGFDFVGARAIVNDDVRLHGAKYAGYARQFMAALALLDPTAPPADYVIKTPESEHEGNDTLTQAPSFFAALVKLFTQFFLRKSK